MCDSPENHQARLRSLEELTEFTENCQRQLNELFETLGWRHDQDNGPEPMEMCPYDPNHRVPSRSMERHKATCQLSQIGYSHEEQAEMYDPSLCYENASITSFTMDKHTQQQVILQARASAPPIRTEGLYSQSEYSTDPTEVPQNQNQKRAICDLTVADRLALFDHVTREGIKQKDQAVATNNEDLYVDLVAKLKKGNDQNEHKSHLELMAEMRDYKRRRQSYRAKNVHNTKKSYTEVCGGTPLNRLFLRRSSEDRRSASIESRQSHASSRDGHVSHHKRHRSEERRKDPSPEQGQGCSREKEVSQRVVD
uniref:CHHC U11-48K-type domain-containing protein n=1 Tax=Oncorhynchus kisutch TaxID=8019 RepID=A0A8C7INH9_ONCKI